MFKFVPSTTTYTKLIDVCDYSIAWPTGDLCLANNGKLYGMATYSDTTGGYNYGAIFEYFLGSIFLPPSFTVTRFYGTSGCYPHPGSSLIQDIDGDPILFGMTYAGYGSGQSCSTGSGNIFEYSINNYTITNKITFTNSEYPTGCLVAFSNDYYGLTYGGGANSVGRLFKWDYSNNTVSTIHSFSTSSNDGYNPWGSLMKYSDNMYGMTTAGGTNGEGTIFVYGDVSYSKKINLNCSDDDDGKTLNFNSNDYLNSKIIIYPNPSANYFTIKNCENANFEVLNMLGEKVLTGQRISGEYKLDVTDLAEGNYLIRIINNSQIFNKMLCIIR